MVENEYGRIIIIENEKSLWNKFLYKYIYEKPDPEPIITQKHKIRVLFDKHDFLYDDFSNPNFSFVNTTPEEPWDHFFFKNFEINDSRTRKYTIFPSSATETGIVYKVHYTDTFLNYIENKFVQRSMYNNVICNESGEKVICIRKQYTGQYYAQYAFEYRKSEFHKDEIAFILHQYLSKYHKKYKQKQN